MLTGGGAVAETRERTFATLREETAVGQLAALTPLVAPARCDGSERALKRRATLGAGAKCLSGRVGHAASAYGALVALHASRHDRNWTHETFAEERDATPDDPSC
jgi:hypothetical protein